MTVDTATTEPLMVKEKKKTFIEEYGTAPWSVLHPFSTEDQVVMTAMRTIVTPNKGKLQGPAARVPYDAIMERVAAPAGVVVKIVFAIFIELTHDLSGE